LEDKGLTKFYTSFSISPLWAFATSSADLGMTACPRSSSYSFRHVAGLW